MEIDWPSTGVETYLEAEVTVGNTPMHGESLGVRSLDLIKKREHNVSLFHYRDAQSHSCIQKMESSRTAV